METCPAPQLPPQLPTQRDASTGGGGAWDSVVRSRDPRRPSLVQLLQHAASGVVLLRGAGDGVQDHGMLLALARFGGSSCVVVGHKRDRPANERESDVDTRAAGELPTAMGPASLRDARRGMRLAKDLRLPLLTVIDTPGAALSREAEESGLAAEIARSLYDLLGLDTPTVSVLLGQGTGGGALALLPADRTLAARHAWLAPLPPEGASAIVHRSSEFAPQLAESQGITATELYATGVVDAVVAELPDAAEEPQEFCRRMGAAIERELAVVSYGAGFSQDRAGRRAKYRALVK